MKPRQNRATLLRPMPGVVGPRLVLQVSPLPWLVTPPDCRGPTSREKQSEPEWGPVSSDGT
jgi:hypothetical protein